MPTGFCLCRCIRKSCASSANRRRMIDILDLLFRERGIRSLIVPANFPALFADQLRAKGYKRAHQTRSVLARARDQEQPRGETDHRILARCAARAGSGHPHAQTHQDQARRLSLFQRHAADFRNAQDRGEHDDHGAGLAAEPHDHLFGQSMRRSAPRGQRAGQGQYLDHLRYLSALPTQRLLRRLEPHRGARPRFGKTQGDLRHGASRPENRLRPDPRRRQRQRSAPEYSRSVRGPRLSHRQNQRPHAGIFSRHRAWLGTGHSRGAAHRAGRRYPAHRPCRHRGARIVLSRRRRRAPGRRCGGDGEGKSQPDRLSRSFWKFDRPIETSEAWSSRTIAPPR